MPLLYTLNQTYYIVNKNYDLGKKVFFNYSGYFYKKNMIDTYMPILDGYVSGQATFSISVPDIKSANNLRHNYTHNLIIYYIDNQKTSGFNTGIPNLPWLGYDKKFSKIEIYNLLNLTKKEIDFVEKNIK